MHQDHIEVMKHIELVWMAALHTVGKDNQEHQQHNFHLAIFDHVVPFVHTDLEHSEVAYDDVTVVVKAVVENKIVFVDAVIVQLSFAYMHDTLLLT